ncbi:DUF1617 family protein [Loigolactobacillus bifermentans]|uniref:DUF1617 family protein n=1 Tax=Loigolactobacillus bifermentans DSM 20003 TaxID=1423726 RepID=A0A0R1HCP6_9LACO|nr:DUF1617 family protein [Loigolactobacillus bifermentans]KRK40887.1 hypothetical protein FC07_GL002640 [Loigolactobacillus bifermentans DSM 20003]QGG59640.1 DUF1617 family protein [Loigolactobacillus bifermentans]
MQLKFKTGRLLSIINFVDNLKITGPKPNRGRYRLSKLVTAKYKECEDERLDLMKKYAELDGGNLKADEKNNVIFKSDEDKQTCLDEEKERQESDAVITVDDFMDVLTEFYQYLCGYNEQLSGSDGFLFGLMLDVFEDAGFTEKEGK